MGRSKKSTEPSIFRFMCITTDNRNYHIDFQSKDEALQYTDELSNSKIEWWGLYELKPNCDHQITVTHKRLIPHSALNYITQETCTNMTHKKRPKKV